MREGIESLVKKGKEKKARRLTQRAAEESGYVQFDLLSTSNISPTRSYQNAQGGLSRRGSQLPSDSVSDTPEAEVDLRLGVSTYFEDNDENSEALQRLLVYGSDHSIAFRVISFILRTFLTVSSSYFNYLYSRSYVELVVEFFNGTAKEKEIISELCAQLSFGFNAAINYTSLEMSIERLSQDLHFGADPSLQIIDQDKAVQVRDWHRRGNQRALAVFGASVAGSIPVMKTVFDKLYNTESLAFVIWMMSSQGITNSCQYYRGLSSVSQYWYAAEVHTAYGYKMIALRRLAAAYKRKYGVSMSSEALEAMASGLMIRKAKGKKFLLFILSLMSIPYSFASYGAARSIYHTDPSQGGLALLADFAVMVLAGLGGVEKAMLLTNANVSCYEYISPSVFPKPKNSLPVRIGKFAFGLFSYGVGSLTLGGAAEGVRIYIFNRGTSGSVLLGSYVIAFFGAININALDFYRLFIDKLPVGISWVKYNIEMRANNRAEINLDIEDWMAIITRLPIRTTLENVCVPVRESVECTDRKRFAALLDMFKPNDIEMQARAAGQNDELEMADETTTLLRRGLSHSHTEDEDLF